MALEWFTYAALGERLGISPEAVRQRAIRHEWTKRTGNDGKAEVRVDADELLAAQPPAPPPKPPSDTGPTPEQPPVVPQADAGTLDVLREMIARADEQTDRERERAADERARADRERDRADALAAELAQLRADGGAKVANVERDVAQLRAVLEEMRRPAVTPEAPAWLRWIATARAGRAG